MAFDRAELDAAFEHYKAVSAKAGSTGDWVPWGELFTDDVTYVEHFYGEMHGRRAVVDWISKTMATPPNDCMRDFPVQWHVVDPERGWVLFCADNVMDDPGDGSDHRAASWSLLKYAGDNRWSYEEDMYNPSEFARMIDAWSKAKNR